MEKNKKLERLDSMLGKKYQYNGREFILLTYRVDGDTVELITDDKKWISDTIYNLNVTLDSFKEIKAPLIPAEITKSTFIIPKDDLIGQIEKGLLEDFKKVRLDKEYIPQAKQSSNTAKEILEARKLRMEEARFLNKFS